MKRIKLLSFTGPSYEHNLQTILQSRETKA